jgi:hypothetical protein
MKGKMLATFDWVGNVQECPEGTKNSNEVEATEIILPEASSKLDFHNCLITTKRMGQMVAGDRHLR